MKRTFRITVRNNDWYKFTFVVLYSDDWVGVVEEAKKVLDQKISKNKIHQQLAPWFLDTIEALI